MRQIETALRKCRRVSRAGLFPLLLFAFGAALLISDSCNAQVTSNVLRRTLLINVPPEFGTAFTIDVDGRQYIVTAKHVVANLTDGATSELRIRRKSGWLPTKVTVYKCADPVDIAVLIPPAQMTVDFPLEPDSKGMIVGQDAYFVGFPYGLEFAQTYDTLPDVFGFVKRATVAQFDGFSTTNGRRIYLDGYNNPGFSGSPLAYRDLNQSGLVFKVAGVIVAYQSYMSPVFDKQEIRPDEITADDRANNRVMQTPDGKTYRLKETPQVVPLNTGIATAWDISSAVDLIRKHPSGPKVSDSFTGD
jgi:hypothetical protein